ncbi:MAG: DNA methyltransferase [Candidatus Hodarchaeales archaeon]|jgi:16S rRNA G966 N2-methylase RsmD
MQQILGPITEGPRPARYRTHLYWARKAPDLAARFIEIYTAPGEKVLDPFCGSGVIPIEAARLGRAGIGFDIDPVGLFIARMTATQANLSKIEAFFKAFLQKIRPNVEPLYETHCPLCFSATAITRVAVWLHEEPMPRKLRGKCHNCGDFSKPPNERDQTHLMKIQESSLPSCVPDLLLRYGNGKPFLKGEGHASIKDLYTHRNVLALGYIREEIDSIVGKTEQDLLLYGFSSILHLASKLTPDRKSRPYSSHWGRMSYWVPPQHQERNVFELLQNALLGRQSVLRGLEDSNLNLEGTRIVSSLTELTSGTIMLKQLSALNLASVLPPSSVDLVFTDPPYGGSVQHFELNSLWASWLSLAKRDPKDEIVINPRQEKSPETFGKMLQTAFEEIYALLKPAKKMVLSFHSTDLRVWKILVQGAIKAGFNLEHLFHQPSRRISFKALAQPLNTAIGDYIFQFERPIRRIESYVPHKGSRDAFSKVVRDSAIKIISTRGQPCTFTELLTGIYPKITRSEFFCDDIGSLQAILKSWLGNGLWLVKAIDPIGKKEAALWWIAEKY